MLFKLVRLETNQKMRLEFTLLLAFTLFVLACYAAFTTRLFLLHAVEQEDAAAEAAARQDELVIRVYEGRRDGNMTYQRRLQVGAVVDSEVTVVSMFFKLARSKHTAAQYNLWTRNFFSSASSSPLVILTNWQSLGALLELSVRTSNPKTIFVFDSIWNVTRLIEAERNNSRYVSAYQGPQLELDPERRIHTPELYAIWNSKPFIMKALSSKALNVYNSKHFIYTDMGAFRMGVFANWPDLSRVVQTGEALGDRVLFGRISESISAPGQNHIEGGFFMGTPGALDAYFADFYAIHDQMLAEGKFVGKDQTIMNTHVVYLHPSKSCTLWAPEFLRECANTYDEWFFYQHFLSGDHTTDQKACNRSAGFMLANKHVVSCNRGAESIAVPVCLGCRSRLSSSSSTSLSSSTART